MYLGQLGYANHKSFDTTTGGGRFFNSVGAKNYYGASVDYGVAWKRL
jgi:hypothetical protein